MTPFEKQIESIFKKAEKEAKEAFQLELKIKLMIIKAKNTYIKKIDLVSGMGTVVFKVNGKFVDDDHNGNLFSEVRGLIFDMAGNYELYPDDMEV